MSLETMKCNMCGFTGTEPWLFRVTRSPAGVQTECIKSKGESKEILKDLGYPIATEQI